MPSVSARTLRAAMTAVVVALLVTPSAARANPIVLDGLADVEGNSNNGFPFNLIAQNVPSLRYQQVYDALGFPGWLLINGLRFRPDDVTGDAFSATLPSMQIDLSTTLAGADGLSSLFASNVGADNVTVFSGPLSISSAGGSGPGPRVFDIVVPFQTPFPYNPAAGNLLVDIRNFGGGLSTQFDASDIVGDSISRVFADDVNALTGSLDTPTHSLGLVTAFDVVTPVPEPASIFLFGLGLTAVARRLRKKPRAE